MDKEQKEEIYNKIRENIFKFGLHAMRDYNNDDIESLTPKRVNKFLNDISGYAAAMEERLTELDRLEAIKWLEIREDTKTNVEADRKWAASELGQEQIKAKGLLKAADRIRTACRDTLKRLNNEAYNSQ